MAEQNSGKAGHEVFISYATEKSDSSKIKDRHVADMICSALEAENIRCWIAHRDILPADDWQNAMIDAVEKAKLLVLIFSSNTEKSQWVMDEIALARDKNIRIIPFQIENVPTRGVFSALRARWQWIEAFTPPLEKHLDRLVNAVKIHLGKGTPHQNELKGVEDKRKTKRATQRSKPNKWRLLILLMILLIFSLFVILWLSDKSFVKTKESVNLLINKLKDSIVELRNTNNKEEIQALKENISEIEDSLDELKKGRYTENFKEEVTQLQIIKRDHENLMKKIELKYRYKINDDVSDSHEEAERKVDEFILSDIEKLQKSLMETIKPAKEEILYGILLNLYICKEYLENQKLKEEGNFKEYYIQVIEMISGWEEDLKSACKENKSKYTSVGKFFNPFSSLINIKAKSIMINSKGFWEADFGDDIIMVYIPEGEFIMGQTDEEKQWLIDKVRQKSYDLYYSDERPFHEVFLPGYWMGKTEVTFVQYDKFCEETDQNKPNDFGWGRGTLPVIYVSWGEADDYCKWLSEKKELKFKLPSEAQWEKAARGTDARWYPWGNHSIYYENKWHANHMAHDTDNRRGEDGYPETSPVGSYPCGDSPYGLRDMAGNVWEWCNDWYNIDFYRSNSSKNPTGPPKGSDRVIRGGSFFHHSDAIRCANREKFTPSDRSNALGLRLCMVNK